MDDWRRQQLPMNILPLRIRWELADHLDTTTATGLGYLRFAAELRLGVSLAYTAQQIATIRERSRESATIALLEDYEARGGIVQGVQYALEAIGHGAQTIIPAFFESIAQGQALFRQGQLYNGVQQTEGSRCNCPQCQQQFHLSGYSPGMSGRQDSVVHQRRIPVDSGYTGNAEPGDRRSLPTFSRGQRSHVTGANRNSITDSGEINERDTTSTNSQESRGEGLLSHGIPTNTAATEVVTGRLNSSTVTSKELSCSPCECNTCRLRSDPEQTQRLTFFSDNKVHCLVNPSYTMLQNGDEGLRVGQRSDSNSSGELSQLYLDSNESGNTCEDVDNSDDTSLNGMFSSPGSESNTVCNPALSSVGSVPNSSTEIRRICSKSDIGQHRLGDKIDDCPVCTNFVGAIPKSGSRSRNNSASQKTEGNDTVLRKSWHGSSGHEGSEQIRKILSDSALLSQFQNTNILLPPRGNKSSTESRDRPITSTTYFKISPHSSQSSDGSENTQTNSYSETYRNNLDSGNERSLAYTQVHSRNITDSNTSNCSGLQNLTSNSPHDRAFSYAQVTVPNIPLNRASQTDSFVSATVNSNRYSEPWGSRQGSGGSGRESEDSFVFVTYSWNGNSEDKKIIQDVIKLCRMLRQAGIQVKIDMDESSYRSLRLSKLDWIDKYVRKAKYVIACITPTYAVDTREPDQHNQASPRSSQLNARYIFDKLREEYYHNQAQNRRVIPVTFPMYGTDDNHIPSCMRSTLIFRYPNQIEQIIKTILGHGRFHPS